MDGPVWTDQQFDEMCWHDNHIHALRIVEGTNGSGELVLDLDYIDEWICGGDGYKFAITPSLLTFREVSSLRISLDYATPMAALGPFSIDGIERQEEQRERYVAQVWKIRINWPRGEISFEAKGFEQRAVSPRVVSGDQRLRPDERTPHH